MEPKFSQAKWHLCFARIRVVEPAKEGAARLRETIKAIGASIYQVRLGDTLQSS